MSRWRLRFVLRIPGPMVLSRGHGCRRIRVFSSPRRSSAIAGGASPVSGFVALFLLGWLGAWSWRTRYTRRRPRVVPAWMIYVGMWTVIIVIVALIV